MANAVLMHTPIHASWLNQIEIYFSIVQRKVLTPNDFLSLAQLEQPSSDYWPSKSIISKLLLPFSGPSLARILTPC